MRLIDAITAQPGPGATLRTGRISAVTGPTCTVDLAGATLTGTPRLSSYSPAVGDVVLILQTGAQLVIIGAPAT